MPEWLLAFLLCFGIANAFTFYVTDQSVIERKIELNNSVFYGLFNSKRALERANSAEELSYKYSRWLRPIGFLIANIIASIIFFSTLTGVH